MNCPHCNKVIIVKVFKDDGNHGNGRPAQAATDDIGELLDQIEDGTLGGAAATFVAETRERYAKYKDRIRFSEKQLSWLKSIAAGEGQDW